MRGRPYPLRYRRALSRLASALDHLAAAIRAHVQRHTPFRNIRMTAREVIERTCTCPPEERPAQCERRYALTDCLAAAKSRQAAKIANAAMTRIGSGG